MKKLNMVLGTVALAVSVMPTAVADFGVDADVKDYTINVIGTELPVSLGSLNYPYYAAERSMAGNCAIELSIDAAGAAESFEVLSCSHMVFEREVRDFARSLSFEPSAQGVHELQVTWE